MLLRLSKIIAGILCPILQKCTTFGGSYAQWSDIFEVSEQHSLKLIGVSYMNPLYLFRSSNPLLMESLSKK